MKSKRKTWLSCILCVCALALTASCEKRTDVKSGGPYIYCLDGERTSLVKITYEIPKGDAGEAADAVLEELARPSQDIEYSPAIPEGVKVNGCEVRHTIAYVDFNQKYLELPSIEEKLVRAAVTQSLILIDGISGIWITIEGEDLQDEAGKPVGILNEDDFVQNTGSSPSSYEKATLILYFANEGGDGLLRQEVDVKYNSNLSREKLIVEKLMKGPGKTGAAYPTLNPDATLLGVTLKNGICYVNFDSEFLNSVYDVRPEITIYSLVNSLVEGSAAERVQITVNGEKNVKYRETIDLSQPFQRDMEWVEDTEEK